MEATKTKSFALEYQIEVLIQTVKISSSSLRSSPTHASCSCCHVFTSVARNSNQIVAMHKSDLACPDEDIGIHIDTGRQEARALHALERGETTHFREGPSSHPEEGEEGGSEERNAA